MTILIVLCSLDLTLGHSLVQCPLTLSDPRSGGWEGGALSSEGTASRRKGYWSSTFRTGSRWGRYLRSGNGACGV